MTATLPQRQPSVVVIGAGFAGLAAAIELRRRGYNDIRIFEKGSDVGGVWRENTYPGAACDVPSPFYSLSYAPNPRWPRRFARQPAILEYIRDVADRYDVRKHVRFDTEVMAASFDETSRTWSVDLSDGDQVEADVVVSAVGQLSRPSYPDVDGREVFAGPTFHSATWDHEVDLKGKRIAVIGTGASAVQFVPEIQRVASKVTIFQRSAPYLLPRPDREYSWRHHRVFEKLPITELAERFTWYLGAEALSVAWTYWPPLAAIVKMWSKRHMRAQTKTRPGLFERVWPDYPIGCKRVLFSDDYLPALAQPNVEVVTEHIRKVTSTGVVTADDVERPFDVIIWGTGFKATEFLAPMSIKGAGGRDLHDQWRRGARAYLGITVANFPNLLLMYGPNTNTGGGSVVYFLETQAKYIGDYVDHVTASGRPLAVRSEIDEAFDNRVQNKLAGTVWSHCSSWYRAPDGRITTNWPFLGIEYRNQARFRSTDYYEVP